MFKKSGIKPPCVDRPGSCPIEDIAPNMEANRVVDAFLRADSFDMSPAYASVQSRLLAESGVLAETPETILEMKLVMRKARESKLRT